MSQGKRVGVNHLLAWVRAEIDAQHRMLSALDAQEQTVSGGSPEELERTTIDVMEALKSQGERRTRLEKILARLAQDLGVPASTMTLGSAAERLGGGPNGQEPRDPNADQLWKLRGELRELVEQAGDRVRRVVSLIGLQRGIVRDVLSALLCDENGDPLQSEGSLIDASA